jgi:putative acetyltransferase
MRVITPTSLGDLNSPRSIFREYANGLNIDFGFQGFEAVLAGLPGESAQPRGAVLMALVDGEVAGCCALRPLDTTDYSNACEMKRLYVRPSLRGKGVGRKLAEAILECARLGVWAAEGIENEQSKIDLSFHF